MGGRRIDPQEVARTFAYKFYRGMFEERDVVVLDPGQFASTSRDAAGGAPIFIIQAQGFLPKVPWDSNTATLGAFERGWVSSGVDTGGQTYYALDVARALARVGQRVIILGQRFGDFPKYLKWYDHASSGGAVEIVRIPAGGIRQGPDGRAVRGHPFVRKEDLYAHLHGMSVDAVAIAMLRGAYGFIGGYADGGVVGVAAGQALGRPSIFIAHSMGLRKLELAGYDPRDPASYFDPALWFGPRLQAERAAFLGADVVVANTPDEAFAYGGLYGIEIQRTELLTPGVHRLFFPNNREAAAEERGTADRLMRKHGLATGKFFISWGRIAAAKNTAGQVRLLGELRRLYPGEYDDVKLVIVGGDPERPTDEERAEMDKVRAAADTYGMTVGFQGDIVRIGSLQQGVIAFVANEAIAYLGTQFHEPFGMVMAEMLAIGGNGFVVSPQVSGFAKWLRMKGKGDLAVILDLGHEGGSQRVDIEAYRRAARAIHEFRQLPDLRDRIRRGARLADESFRWRAQAERLRDLLTKAARDPQPRPSLHLAMPAWHSPPQPLVRSRWPTSATPSWAAVEGGVPRPHPGIAPPPMDSDALVRVAREIGAGIAAWLRSPDVQTRQLITVAGQEAALLADLIAAAIDGVDSRVQRVAGEAWSGGKSEEVRAAVKANPLAPAAFVSFGGVVFVEDRARGVVTDVPVGEIDGDVNVVASDVVGLDPNAHILVSSGQWMFNPAHPPPFAVAR